MTRFSSCIFAALLLAPLASLHAAEVANLRCEYRENPLGIDVVKPRLSWLIEDRDPRSKVRGIKQTAYQVLVASSEELLKKDKGNLWDSGKVEGELNSPMAAGRHLSPMIAGAVQPRDRFVLPEFMKG